MRSPVVERVVVTQNREAATVVRLLHFLESFPAVSFEEFWEASAVVGLEDLVA